VFDSARKWSALVIDGDLYVLGAPEVLRDFVQGWEAYEDDIEAWAAQGLRVLLFAGRKDVADVDFEASQPLKPGSLEPYGLIVLRDELRRDAAETVARFTRGGVRLKILSGDNPDTVAALARQAGFEDAAKAIAGPDLNGLDEEQLAEVAAETTIFGRVSPDDKEQLVQALQHRGHYVAMIGDGVNDIPALKAAHVAAVMRSGSPATRSVADIVLLEDSFGALSYALLEGQRIRQGMEGVVRLFLVRTLAISLVILTIALLSDPFPITPRQSAIVAALTVGIPAVALAAWARPGKSPHLLLPGAVAFVLPAAVTVGIVGIAVYEAFLNFGATLDEARTALTLFGVLCGVGLIPYSVLSQNDWLKRAGFQERPRLTALAAVMLLLYVVASSVPALRSFYEIEVLEWWQYIAICGAAVAWALMLRLLVRSGFDEWLGDRTQRLLESRGAVAT
jgi:cation-transporting ATPase E